MYIFMHIKCYVSSYFHYFINFFLFSLLLSAKWALKIEITPIFEFCIYICICWQHLGLHASANSRQLSVTRRAKILLCATWMVNGERSAVCGMRHHIKRVTKLWLRTNTGFKIAVCLANSWHIQISEAENRVYINI